MKKISLLISSVLASSLFISGCLNEDTATPPSTETVTPLSTETVTPPIIETTWYADTDGDLYGDATDSLSAVDQPANYVIDNTDCNDGDSSINPSVDDINDEKDNNCDGTINDGPYIVGQWGPAGGLVFYTLDGLTGLEVANVDLGASQWFCAEFCANKSTIGSGFVNAIKSTNDFIFTTTNNFEMNGFNDWFVPSKDSLNEIYTQIYLNGIGDFNDTYCYWSSTYAQGLGAWFQCFSDGHVGTTYVYTNYLVIAARKF